MEFPMPSHNINTMCFLPLPPPSISAASCKRLFCISSSVSAVDIILSLLASSSLSSSLLHDEVTPQPQQIASDAAKSTKFRATWSFGVDDDDDDESWKNSLDRYGCTSFPSAKRDFNLLASSSLGSGVVVDGIFDWSIVCIYCILTQQQTVARGLSTAMFDWVDGLACHKPHCISHRSDGQKTSTYVGIRALQPGWMRTLPSTRKSYRRPQ
eukprot:scaffold17390_cov162-Skeletonema_dohrnii-CCMP3373.AAC.1